MEMPSMHRFSFNEFSMNIFPLDASTENNCYAYGYKIWSKSKRFCVNVCYSKFTVCVERIDQFAVRSFHRSMNVQKSQPDELEL